MSYEQWQAHPFLVHLRDLLQTGSPPGHEFRMAKVIREKLIGMGYEPLTDAAGNLLVRIPGSDAQAGSMVIAAHMDEIALVVTRIENDGTLRIDRSGKLDPEKIGEGPIDIIGDDDSLTPAILSFGSGHAARGPVTWPSVKVLTGLTPEQLEQRGVRVGSTATPPAWRRGPVLLGSSDNPLVAAWTFDDRGGMVTLLRLLERIQSGSLKPSRPMIAAFTIHEEGGCHGAKALCHREQPEIFIALDGTPMTPDTSLKLDGRPCVWSKDALTNYDPRLIRQLAHAAKQADTSIQHVVMQGPYSDASSVYNVGGAPRVATFGHVRENSHGFEVAPLKAFDLALETLSVFIQNPIE